MPGALIATCVLLLTGCAAQGGAAPSRSAPHQANRKAGGAGRQPSIFRSLPGPNRAPRRLLTRIALRVGSSRRAHVTVQSVVRFRQTDYHMDVYNPESPIAFTLLGTTVHDVAASAASATIVSTIPTRFTFASRQDAVHWRASGTPRLPAPSRRGDVMNEPKGRFSFLSLGTTLNYEAARHLPTSSRDIEAAVLSHVRSYASDPSTALLLVQYGVLLAIAPISPPVRMGLLTAAARLPELHACRHHFRDMRYRTVCADSDQREVELVLDQLSGRVRAVREYLRQRLPYTGLHVGALVECQTFVIHA